MVKLLSGWVLQRVLVLVFWCMSSSAEAYYFYNKQGYMSGCADSSTEGLQDERHTGIAACSGMWYGHIENATSLCAKGWTVCSWKNQPVLKTLTWKDATLMSGCYAFNAAQDGGSCKPCISNLEQDDLAGVGRGCPHQSYGQNSCITGGQIDVSCCIDTHFHRACTYRPGLATGILCCKLPGVPPQILVQPQALTHVTTGVTFVLSCQAMGTPTPTVSWFKNGHMLPNNQSRISVFDSGYMLISQAEPSDAGDYQCFVSNSAGNDSINAKVIITDHRSGCADETTDGLYQYEDIQACKGAWEGHVKRGRSLCARKWRVCSARNADLLKMLTWNDVMGLDGCYAYNAANTLNGCSRCHRGDMAGMGSACGKIHRTDKSCLAEGRVDVYKGQTTKGCHFRDSYITGVMCCKKPDKYKVQWWKQPACKPKCAHGGRCTKFNHCKCAPGYKGAWCQNPICPGGCIPNALCIRPGVCQCKHNYTGSKCRPRLCKLPCLSGGRCKRGRCKCPLTHHGDSCQHVSNWRTKLGINRTER